MKGHIFLILWLAFQFHPIKELKFYIFSCFPLNIKTPNTSYYKIQNKHNNNNNNNNYNNNKPFFTSKMKKANKVKCINKWTCWYVVSINLERKKIEVKLDRVLDIFGIL